MRYKELTEVRELTQDQFDEYMENHLQGFKSAVALRKMIQSKIGQQYTKPFGQYVYRAWQLSDTQIAKLQGGMYSGPRNNRIKAQPQSIVLNYKAKLISYSWSEKGAKIVAQDDRFRSSKTIITKTKLNNPNDILLNILQYGKQNPRVTEIRLIRAEQEVILSASSTYTTINPEDIITIV